MKGNDILKLARAGFSIEQICLIDETLGLPGDLEESPAPAADPIQDPTPEPSPEPTPDPGEAVASRIEAAAEQLAATLERIQKANIGSARQPAREEESVDSILASLINGPKPGPEKEG